MKNNELNDLIFNDEIRTYEITEFEKFNIDFNRTIQIIEICDDSRSTLKIIYY